MTGILVKRRYSQLFYKILYFWGHVDIWADGQLVGSISVERKDEGGQAIGEIGYMILTPWWSQGIGTEAVRQICEIAFQEMALVRCFLLKMTVEYRLAKPGRGTTASL